MKTCTECDRAHEDLACACQTCGTTTWMVHRDDLEAVIRARTQQQASADHVDRGVGHMRQRRWELAKQEIRKAQEINPLNPIAWSNYGHVLLFEGKARDAIPYLEKALSLNPKLEGVANALDRARRVLEA